MSYRSPLHLVTLTGQEQLQVIPIAPVSQQLGPYPETCTTADIAALAGSVGALTMTQGTLSLSVGTLAIGAGLVLAGTSPNASLVATQSGMPARLYVYLPSVAGTLSATQTIWEIDCLDSYTFPAGLTGSSVKADMPATASTTLTLFQNGSAKGTAVFAPTGTTATLSMSGSLVTASGDLLAWKGPASPDVGLAGIRIGMKGTFT